jgi:hypothetical protein
LPDCPEAAREKPNRSAGHRFQHIESRWPDTLSAGIAICIYGGELQLSSPRFPVPFGVRPLNDEGDRDGR